MARRSRTTQLASSGSWAPVAGILLLLAGSGVLLAIITAEALYPVHYSVHSNTVSDLAAMGPRGLVRQPSAALFNWTMIATGGLIIVASLLFWTISTRIDAPAAILAVGAGALGVGIFPGNHEVPHELFAMLAFVAGAVAAMLSARLEPQPLRFVSFLLGLVSLSSLVVGLGFTSWAPAARLGTGGIERWVIYPIALWMISFGSYLCVARPPAEPSARTPGAPEARPAREPGSD